VASNICPLVVSSTWPRLMSLTSNYSLIIMDIFVMLIKVNIMSNINEPFVNDRGRFEVVFVSPASSRYQLRLSILGLLTPVFCCNYHTVHMLRPFLDTLYCTCVTSVVAVVKPYLKNHRN